MMFVGPDTPPDHETTMNLGSVCLILCGVLIISPVPVRSRTWESAERRLEHV
jgi:hypothetical protein